MSEWHLLTLGESLELLIDNRGKNPPYVDAGIPAISGQNVSAGGRLDLRAARFVSVATWRRWMPRPTQRGDVIMTSEAPLGRVARIESDEPLALTQRVFGLRGAPGVLDTGFLFYALQTDMVQGELAGRATGTTVVGIRQPSLRAVRLRAPGFAEQQAIAEVLSTIDEMRVANDALVAAVDELLATEFRSRLLTVETVERPIGSVATVVLGGTPSRARADYWTGGSVPWLNSGAVNATRITKPSELITAEALQQSAAKLMPVGATLLAITGATLGQIARLELQAAGNQSIVGVWSEDQALNTWIYFAVRSRIDDLLARATGAAQQHVSKGDVAQLAIPIPAESVLAQFASAAIPLLELAASVSRENQKLGETVDVLLRHLMSGRLHVRDVAARTAEERA